ncbi:hypothetical protein OG21DRAFT_1507854 [Imleria badia]|nr:hypothetical protein OG21DRAFT_1507854 [Imleria badia]
MHHALQIPEILLNICGHCHLPSWHRDTPDLPALARTCRTFKEPALDVLWEALVDPSPLAKCLPEASYYSQIHILIPERWSFSRPLTQIEWGILRSYTRRIRSIWSNEDRLDWQSVNTFLNPPATEPLFPNLRHLCAAPLTAIGIKHLWCMPFPSLISLSVGAQEEKDLCQLQGSLESFSKFSPNLRRLSISLPHRTGIMFGNFVSSNICRWRDLHTVDCSLVALDVDALVHLSRMPALTLLNCIPSASLPPSGSPLFFSNLRHMTLSSEFLDAISRLLSWIRLPAIVNFSALIQNRPSKQAFSSLASVQTSVINHAIQELRFKERFGVYNGEDAEPVLGFEDLQPFMVFGNLHHIDLDLSWGVDLADSELLTLASAWPHLEHLVINVKWGWNTPGGITPNGLLQLLWTCRSLSDIALAIDTRGYTEFRASPASLGLTLPPMFCIDVLDSFIEQESVPAIADFLAYFASRSEFELLAYQSRWFTGERTDHEDRWYDAYNRANDALS